MSASTRPTVEMLWESADAHVALTRRFGFADVRQAIDWLGNTLAEHWGIRLLECERLVISAGNALAWLRTTNGRQIAKWSVVKQLYPRLGEIAGVTAWLHDKGFPVSAPVPTIAGEHQLEVDGVSLGVQDVIEGELLDVTDPDQVYEAGAHLGVLQSTLAGCPGTEAAHLLASRPYEPLRTRVTEWLDSPDARPALTKAVRDRLPEPRDDDALPVQLVHNDFRSANILCERGKVVAVLDFEEVSFDCRVKELARASVLLGTRYHLWAPIAPGTRQRFFDGYRSVVDLSPAEEVWLDALVLWETARMAPDGDDPAGWAKSAMDWLVWRDRPGSVGADS